MNATFTGKDQNWQDGTTTYWFAVSGYDAGFDVELDGTVGLVESDTGTVVIDSDGFPIEGNLAMLVRRVAVVAPEMRNA